MGDIITLVRISDIVVTLMAIVAGVLALRAVLFIQSRGRPKTLGDWLPTVFTLVALGFVMWALGEIGWVAISWMGGEPYGSIADFFYAFGYLPITAGFLMLWYNVQRSREMTGNEILMYALTAIGAMAAAFFTVSLIIGQQTEETGLQQFLDYFYPIASMLTFISTLKAYALFAASRVKQSMLLIAGGIFVTFIGDMLFTYLSWGSVFESQLGVVDNGIYVLSYALVAAGFWVLATPDHEKAAARARAKA
jgi:hypothetical protein